MFFQSHRYYHAISPILCLFCWFCALCRKKWLTLRGRFGNRPYSQAVSLAATEAAKVTKILFFQINNIILRQDKIFSLMDGNIKDKIEYIIAFISEFAKAHSISNQDAYLYLDHYNAIHTLNQHYSIAHTLSFEDVVDTFTNFCRRKGGKL
jgi:hypothetical protein